MVSCYLVLPLTVYSGSIECVDGNPKTYKDVAAPCTLWWNVPEASYNWIAYDAEVKGDWKFRKFETEHLFIRRGVFDGGEMHWINSDGITVSTNEPGRKTIIAEITDERPSSRFTVEFMGDVNERLYSVYACFGMELPIFDDGPASEFGFSEGEHWAGTRAKETVERCTIRWTLNKEQVQKFKTLWGQYRGGPVYLGFQQGEEAMAGTVLQLVPAGMPSLNRTQDQYKLEMNFYKQNRE